MRRPWESDRRLSQIPLGWRRVAWHVLAVGAEHCLNVDVIVQWSATPKSGLPCLWVVDRRTSLTRLPERRATLQFLGHAFMDRIAKRAVTVCMGCGRSSSPPAHVELQVAGARYIALLCMWCEDTAAIDGHDYWSVLGRFDPLLDASDDEDNPFLDDLGWPDDDEDGLDFLPRPD